MRLINADALIEILTTAIRNMKGVAKFIGAEDDPELKMEIKAYTDILNGVKEQPTIEPEPHWIPCSERLPEEYGNYLITTSDGDVDIGSIDPNKKSGWSACDADGFYWLRNVIAWMPLPGGYKGEQDE